jgi:hypothetical protein
MSLWWRRVGVTRFDARKPVSLALRRRWPLDDAFHAAPDWTATHMPRLDPSRLRVGVKLATTFVMRCCRAGATEIARHVAPPVRGKMIRNQGGV